MMYMHIKPPHCALEISYNFIHQLYLNRAEILRNVLINIACLLAELSF